MIETKKSPTKKSRVLNMKEQLGKKLRDAINLRKTELINKAGKDKSKIKLVNAYFNTNI